jgi:hypothetical protein
MQARFQHTRRPLSDQFRQSSGILERNFFTICRLFYLYFGEAPQLFPAVSRVGAELARCGALEY